MTEGQEVRQRSGPSMLLVFGIALQVLLTLASPYTAFVSGIRSDACDGDCGYGAIGFGSGLAIAGPLLLVVIVLVVAVLRFRTRIAWLPYAGIVATFALWWLAFEVAGAGLPGGTLAP